MVVVVDAVAVDAVVAKMCAEGGGDGSEEASRGWEEEELGLGV